MIVAWLTGLLFGVGLIVSQMVNPAKVIGFLDVTGHWDPSLMFVMIGALLVFGSGYWLIVRRLKRPLLAGKFQLPTRRDLDARLLIGAAIFGVGWGAAGICPGPAIASIASGSAPLLAFVLAMIAGLWLAGQIVDSRVTRLNPKTSNK